MAYVGAPRDAENDPRASGGIARIRRVVPLACHPQEGAHAMRVRVLAAALVVCAWLLAPGVSPAAQTLRVQARFTPEKLGAPTNLSATATFGSTLAGPQPPAIKVTVFGPKGMSVDTRGAGTCTASPVKLLEAGPSACPADSRIGFGSGIGLFELAGEIIKGHYTLEFFLARAQAGHLAMLIYVNSTTPAAGQKVLIAREVNGPSPYGLGITFGVSESPTLPGALPGWEEHVSITLGAAHVAYYRTVHGKRRLFHVRGIVLPKRCPHGGFPIQSGVEFADGTSAIANTTVPCPRG